MTYEVTFYQSTVIQVEADSPQDAFKQALPQFESEMRRPIARTDYDDYDVEAISDAE